MASADDASVLSVTRADPEASADNALDLSVTHTDPELRCDREPRVIRLAIVDASSNKRQILEFCKGMVDFIDMYQEKSKVVVVPFGNDWLSRDEVEELGDYSMFLNLGWLDIAVGHDESHSFEQRNRSVRAAHTLYNWHCDERNKIIATDEHRHDSDTVACDIRFEIIPDAYGHKDELLSYDENITFIESTDEEDVGHKRFQIRFNKTAHIGFHLDEKEEDAKATNNDNASLLDHTNADELKSLRYNQHFKNVGRSTAMTLVNEKVNGL